MAKLKLLDDTWLRPNVEYMEAKRNILRNKRMGVGTLRSKSTLRLVTA